MNRPIAEKTICCLLAIAFSVLIAQAQSRVFTIQVESAPSEAEAKSSVAKLQANGVEAYWVKAEVPGKGTRYRIRIGKYKNQAEAKVKADQLLGGRVIKEFIITLYDPPSSDFTAQAAASRGSKPAPSVSTAREQNRLRPGQKARWALRRRDPSPILSG